MRLRSSALVLILTLVSATPSFAQDWIEFTSREDRFTANVPGQPKVEEIKWDSEYGAVFPGRVYSAADGLGKYSITVIDYTDARDVHLARTNRTEADSGDMYWQIDIRGSIQYAATKYRMKPGVKVTYDAWHYIDLVEGHQLQITNPDQSRTFVSIYLHERRLYILEATVPARMPAPGLFQNALGFIDQDGKRVRYDSIYSNVLPPIN